MVLVTDVKRVIGKGTKSEKEVTGFYMQGYLKKNLDGIPSFLKKSWDCVCIVSGHGKVRIGKSTMGAQVAYYTAWRLAGGETIVDENNSRIVNHVPPKNPVRFILKENVVFSAEELQETATKLYNKYGGNQVILYDEGRQGLDSARAMESINKGMEDFFQECGFMGHVIIIVLPSFFKLHEDYAVARSLFLIDVFADKDFNRGYFNFYNERQKEYLYFFGKKKIGISAKYSATNENFWGKFTAWLPFDKDEYEQMKKVAMERKRLSRADRRIRLQRDVLVWMLNKDHGLKPKEIAKRISDIAELKISHRTLGDIITKINEVKIRTLGY